MAKSYYDRDADLKFIQGRKIGVIGYGSQGHAHALNLHDTGLDVRVGLPAKSRSRDRARNDGLHVASVSQVADWADVIVILAPDTIQPEIFRKEVAPGLSAGKTLLFAHGFNIRFGTIAPPAGVDVVLVAPKAPGHRLRETFQEGAGTPALVAVENDASGHALQMALAYAKALGCTRAGVIQTTFAEETETDLFGEQAVLCGGVSELIRAGFDTLVEAGYQPEVAYFECLHELKLIVDLMYRGGLSYMRYSISDTAEFGDYHAGPKVIDENVRKRMKELLAAVQDGSFAQLWIEECAGGQKNFKKQRASQADHPIEEVGARLRAAMPFLEASSPPKTAASAKPRRGVREVPEENVPFF